MIDRAHRIVRGDDYRATVRRGRRMTTTSAVIYAVPSSSEASSTTRFGFIVSKAVGNAVVRNRMRRRLKSIAADHLHELEAGSTDAVRGEVVVRALPGSHSASWATLKSEIGGALRDGAWSRGKARA